jgi:hypothetical protein
MQGAQKRGRGPNVIKHHLGLPLTREKQKAEDRLSARASG